MPENPASYRVVRTKSYLFNKAPEQSSDEVKDNIINVIKAELKIVEAKQEKDKAEVTPLAHFDSKGMFVRNRVKGRNFFMSSGALLRLLSRNWMMRFRHSE
nr:hypothetical protein [Escherichia coli]